MKGQACGLNINFLSRAFVPTPDFGFSNYLAKPLTQHPRQAALLIPQSLSLWPPCSGFLGAPRNLLPFGAKSPCVLPDRECLQGLVQGQDFCFVRGVFVRGGWLHWRRCSWARLLHLLNWACEKLIGLRPFEMQICPLVLLLGTDALVWFSKRNFARTC